jgi:hypothetical protein
MRRTLACLVGLAFLASSCGTVLYPDRHGRRGGRVDPVVLLLDGAFLLLFIIPGLVAFAIDFYTGAVYMPASGERDKSLFGVAPSELDAARIEALVRAHTGVPVRLDDPRLVRLRLADGADPAQVLERLRAAGYDAAPARLAELGAALASPTPAS